MLVDNKDYFEEDIEALSEVPDVYPYGRTYRGYRKGKGKVFCNSKKGGLVKSYKDFPLWTKEQQKIMDKVDKVLEKWN